MSTKAKLNKLLKTKEDIKKAIQNKGGNVGDVFDEYPAAIRSLEAGNINVADSGIKFAYSTFEEIPSIYDFSDVTNASQIFADAVNLKSLKNFNAENLVDLTSAFYNCYKLEDISNLKITSSVNDLYRMFYDCYALKSIDLSNWDTSNVNDMSGTFQSCTGLTEIDITPLDFSKITSISNMFEGCRNLETIKGVIDAPLYTSAFSTNSTPFRNCYVLRNFDGMRHNNTMYYDTCYLLSEQSVKNIFNVLPEVSVSKTVYFSQDVINQMSDEDIAIATNKGWTVSPAKSISEPIVVTSLSVIPFSTKMITPKTYDFSQYSGRWGGNLGSNLPCYNVIRMFNGDLTNTTSADSMFRSCSNLEYITLTNTSNITDMSNMFMQCNNLKQIDIEDTSNVTVMTNMFTYCDFKEIDLSGWNTGKVTNIGGMFQWCSALESVNFGYCDLSNTTSMSSVFYACTSLKSVTMRGPVPNSIYTANMFDGINTEGTFYYNPAYDYSPIIAVLPPTWTAVPITE